MPEQYNNWHLGAEVYDNVAAIYEEADTANADEIGNTDKIGLAHFTNTWTTENPKLRNHSQ
jgi:hypothetical protein